MRFTIRDILWATALAAIVVNQWRVCGNLDEQQEGILARLNAVEGEDNPILWSQAHGQIQDHEQRLKAMEKRSE